MTASDMNDQPELKPIVESDPIVQEAAKRAFSDLADQYFDRAKPGSDENLRLRQTMLDEVDALGFCDALNPDDPRTWIDSATIIRAQAEAAAPVDMVTVLVKGNRDEAIATDIAHYEARVSGSAGAESSSEPDPQDQLLAMGRCLQLTAAMQIALDISLQYVQDRQQFGRPLAKFQAVQHTLAMAAEEVASATAMTDLALASLAKGGTKDAFAHQLDAAAIVCCGAVTTAFFAAHQVHGAIGFTQEYPLHRYTINLLHWRDDLTSLCGSEIQCAERLGQATTSFDTVWSALTAMSEVNHD